MLYLDSFYTTHRLQILHTYIPLLLFNQSLMLQNSIYACLIKQIKFEQYNMLNIEWLQDNIIIFRMWQVLILAIITFVHPINTCNLNPNKLPTITDKPLLLKQTKNGQKLLIGDINSPQRDYIWVANLKGTPFEMGEAFGELFENELKDQIKQFYGYYQQLLKPVIAKKVPAFLAPFAEANSMKMLRSVLYLNVLITRKYTNPRYFEQAKGISKGAKIKQKQITMLNIFPELLKAKCTVAGVWGTASENSHTLHMRSLDWDFNAPINKYPIIVAYHPSNKLYQSHANVAWVGFVGSMTGISTKVSVGQKVWIPHDQKSVPTTRYGNPWTYVLRDVLYDAVDMSSALKILLEARRTCAIHLGLASVPDQTFRMMEYSYKNLTIYDDKNYSHYNAKTHPKKDGIAYFDKHTQPSDDSCVGDLLTNSNFYGKWTAQDFWRVVGNSHETGDTQLVVFDLKTLTGLISYSKYNGSVKAFKRTPIFVNFDQLLKAF